MLRALSTCTSELRNRSNREDGQLWWSSVWLYPRAQWPWSDDAEEEICFAYNWPVENWMKPDEPNGGGEPYAAETLNDIVVANGGK